MVIFAYQLIYTTMTNHRAPRPNLNPKSLPTLALAGRAVLTFRNLEAGTHMTVKIKQLTDKRDRKIKLPIYYVFISLLGDSRQGYEFAGTLFSETMTISLGRKVAETSRLANAFRWVLASIKNPAILTGRVGLFHEGRCCACGLPLTHPESINTALGPVCFNRMVASASRNLNVAESFAPIGF